MFCSSVMLLYARWGYIACHTGADYRVTPKRILWNPLRWQIGIGPKRPCAIVLNRDGRLFLRWANFRYRWFKTAKEQATVRALEEGRRKDVEARRAAMTDASAATPPVDWEVVGPKLVQDAERFRALMRCGRIKMQGSSGVNPHTLERNGNGVHFGAEFWPQPPKPEHAHLDGGERSTKWGRACLMHLADAIIEHEAALAATQGEGVAHE